MGVAIFPPNCIHDGFSRHRNLISPPRPTTPRRTSNGSTTARSTCRRKRSRIPPTGSPLHSSKLHHQPTNDDLKDVYRARISSGLAMGEVRILKREEDLTQPPPASKDQLQRPPASKAKEEVGCLGYGRDRELNHGGFYAGSGMFISPPPSSVPLPAFCSKKMIAADDVAVDLRRILRLE